MGHNVHRRISRARIMISDWSTSWLQLKLLATVFAC